MAKLIGPVLSLSASGSLKKSIVFQKTPGGHKIYLDHSKKGITTTTQETIRTNFRAACDAWKALSTSAQETWNDDAKFKQMTGFNYYVKRYIETAQEPVPPTPWSPLDIAGAQVWHEADQIVGLNDGDDIGSLPDGSGTGNILTQATASKKPHFRTNIANGKPAMLFDATASQVLSKATPIGIPTGNNPLTVFIILKDTHAATMYALYWGPAECVKAFHILPNTGGDWLYGCNCHGQNAGFSTTNNGLPHIASITYNGTVGKIWMDGTPGANATYTPWNLVSQDYQLGYGTGAIYYTGYIFGDMIYNTCLSDANRILVENYFKTKYAIP